jgi:hypothetical protein
VLRWTSPLCQAGEKGRLQRVGPLTECEFCQLQNAGGIGNDLHCFNAANVVEKPSATGVHQLCVALHLHQFECMYALAL